MARYDWYILRIWRSGRRSGEQWAARLEAMPEGESRRFTEPEQLLEHLWTMIQPGDAGPEGMPPEGGQGEGPGAHKTTAS